MIGLEVKRTYDKNGKTRYGVVCKMCNTRVFLNNWEPGPRSRTIVRAEQEGLWIFGLIPERKLALLAELGLKPAPQPAPHLQNLPHGWAGSYPQPYTPVQPAPRPRRAPRKTK